jgi:hypothetical protein
LDWLRAEPGGAAWLAALPRLAAELPARLHARPAPDGFRGPGAPDGRRISSRMTHIQS